MYLKEIKIKNFRLLQNVTIALDKELTLFVGKNNSGKTSVMEIIRMVAADGNSKKDYRFADYPLYCRETLYQLLWKYWHNQISYDELMKSVPQTSVRFVVDYSSEGMEDSLGALSDFIADIIEGITVAIIEAVYSFLPGEEKLKSLYESYQTYVETALVETGNVHKNVENAQDATADDISSTTDSPTAKIEFTEKTEQELNRQAHVDIMRRIVEENFAELFNLKIYAVAPDDEDDRVERSGAQFRNLFIYHTIRAERSLDESDAGSDSSIRTIINRIFSADIDNMEEELRSKISDFKALTETYGYGVQNEVNERLSEIVGRIAPFGYPTADDLQLKADTSVSIKDDIINNTNLTYIYGDAEESLPSTHNGLGYKNLIMISLQLQEFANMVKQSGLGAIPLLFIEEPEAHMHPQLQRTFIEYLTSVIERMAGFNIQLLVTTHASHIANTVSFRQIRYMKKHGDRAICKNLVDFLEASKVTYVSQRPESTVATADGAVTIEGETAEGHVTDSEATDNESAMAKTEEEIRTENEDFLQKYMKVSFCDLYFCDKAIIVEGAAERLLIPDMIRKLHADGKFNDVRIPLSSQYYTVMEVGGAYAFRFFEFIDFLEVPTLIITDADYVKGTHGKQCEYTDSPDTTSNATIRRWYKEAYDIKEKTQKVLLNEIDQLAGDSNKKTISKRHLEFQLEENGYKPRSLEDSIINANRGLFGLTDKAAPVYDESKYGKKTEFALKLLIERQYGDYKIPSYIERGLMWLNSQAASE